MKTKKVLPSERGLVALYLMINPALVIALFSQKRLDEGLRLQLLGQKPSILPGYTFKLVVKN